MAAERVEEVHTSLASPLVPHEIIQLAEYSLKSEGDHLRILHQLFIKQQLTEQGMHEEADKIHIGIALGPGALQGFTHAAFLKIMRKYGLLQYVDRVVGVSTGAAAAVVGIGLTDESAADLYVQIAQYREIDERHVFKGIIDTEAVGARVREHVDHQNLLKSKTKVSVIVTDMITGKKREIEVNRLLDPVSHAINSSTPPIAKKFPAYISGRFGVPIPVMDGIFSDPLPLESEFDDDTTHWLVINPAPPSGIFPDWQIKFMQLCSALKDSALKDFPLANEAVERIRDTYARSYERLQTRINNNYNVALVYPDQTFDQFTNDWAHLRHIQGRAEDAWRVELEKARAYRLK